MSAITISHMGKLWLIYRQGHSYFVRDERGSDTGPWNSACQAIEWVRSIAPVLA